MFSYCQNLTSLHLSTFNTQNVKSMRDMFSDSISLTYLDLSSFKTEKVIDMNCMFWGCTNLINLDLSSFNTENVTNYTNIFKNGKKLERVILNLDERKIKYEISSSKIIYS